MKRLLLTTIAATLFSYTESQVMKVHFKDGQTSMFDIPNIDRIEWPEDYVNHPYLTFHSNKNQSFSISKVVETLEYSVNGSTWEELGGKTIEFGGTKGDLRLRGNSEYGTAKSTTSYSTFQFSGEGKVSCSGDIFTLVNYDSYRNYYPSDDIKFCYLFSGCSSLVSAPNLMSGYIYKDSYVGMFKDCTSLASAPEIPTGIEESCFKEMFANCTSLVNAPELRFTTLKPYCYSGMFAGCTSLVNAPELPSEKMEAGCYSRMFAGCTSLKDALALPAASLANACYREMFDGCVSLTSAPDLISEDLADSCYMGMFSNCVSLNSIRMLATDISAKDCLSNWVYNVATSGTFTKDINANWEIYGDSGIPTNWRIINDGSTLPPASLDVVLNKVYTADIVSYFGDQLQFSVSFKPGANVNQLFVLNLDPYFYSNGYTADIEKNIYEAEYDPELGIITILQGQNVGYQDVFIQGFNGTDPDIADSNDDIRIKVNHDGSLLTIENAFGVLSSGGWYNVYYGNIKLRP